MTECQVSCWSEHTVQFVMYSVVICIYNIHSRYSPFLPISNLVQVNSLALNVISSYYIKQFSSSSPPFPPPSPPSPPSPPPTPPPPPPPLPPPPPPLNAHAFLTNGLSCINIC